MSRCSITRPARSLALVALALTGCYFEGSVGVHPSISQKVTTPRNPAVPGSVDRVDEGSGAGWSLAFKIGFYYDVLIRSASTQIGLGVAPPGFNGQGIAPFADEEVRIAARGMSFRTDVFIPSRLFSPKLQKRLTLAYDWLPGGTATIPPSKESSATKSSNTDNYFLGVSVGGRFSFLARSLFLFSVGAEYFKADLENEDGRRVDLSSAGVGARLMIHPRFIGTYQPGWYGGLPGDGEPSQLKAGCYYREQCTAGTCVTDYHCP